MTNMFVDYHVQAYDREGDLINETIVEEAGSFRLESLRPDVLSGGLAELEVEAVAVEIRDEDGETIQRWEKNR